MLIGDPCQAIYEWRKARPDIFKAQYEAWKTNSVEYNESFRSSQQICDFFGKLSPLTNRIISRNDDATALGIIPEIIGYEHDQQHSLIPTFLDKCMGNSILPEENDIVVLTRGRGFIRDLVGKVTNQEVYPWNDNFTRELCLSKYLYEKHKPAAAYKRLEKAICNLLKGTLYCIQVNLEEMTGKYGFSEW
jgi:superfamily I DNA/RNA helicase